MFIPRLTTRQIHILQKTRDDAQTLNTVTQRCTTLSNQILQEHCSNSNRTAQCGSVPTLSSATPLTTCALLANNPNLTRQRSTVSTRISELFSWHNRLSLSLLSVLFPLYCLYGSSPAHRPRASKPASGSQQLFSSQSVEWLPRCRIDSCRHTSHSSSNMESQKEREDNSGMRNLRAE